ncbi:MAG: DNA polymerase I [Firmicutes bacterium]|nr:DNA polymerase I [Bacillota bacterium]
MAKKTTSKKPAVTGCEACPLNNTIKVPGVGPNTSPLLIVGEAPGYQEIRQGIPFVGPAGRELNLALTQAGLNRADCYITNSFMCFPQGEHPISLTKVANCCKTRLLDEVRSHQPKVVLALGKIATKSLLGLNVSMTTERGRVCPAPHLGENTVVVLAYHPAYILRNPRAHRDLLADVSKAGRLAYASPSVEASTIKIDYEVLPHHYAVLNYFNHTTRHPVVALDIETGSDRKWLCLGLSTEKGKAVVIPQAALAFLTRELQEWLNGKLVVGHNLVGFDRHILADNGVEIKIGADTMLESYVLNTFVGGHGLKTLIREHLEFYEDYSADTHRYIKCMELCPPEDLYRYNGYDTALTYMLHFELNRRLDNQDHRVLNELLYPASDVLFDMERIGIAVDIPYLERLSEQLVEELAGLEKQMFEIVGGEFNPRSNPQLMDVMFNRLGLAIPTRFSTDKKALDLLEQVTAHPFLPLLRQYKENHKFYSTYAKALLVLAKASADERIHTSYGLHTTATGRLSSRRPNLQNQRQDSKARNIFIASPNYTLIEGDFSALEMRVWAWYSRDNTLRSSIMSQDAHTATAHLMFGVPLDAVTKEQRYAGKRLSFATLYQQEARSLAKELGLSVGKAIELQEKFFITYLRGGEWIKEQQQRVRRDGFFVTPFGRKLQFANNPNDKFEIDRTAVNYPIQSVGSDITLSALIRLHKRIRSGDFGTSRLLLTVHDSVLLETTENAQDTAYEMQIEMEKPALDEWIKFSVDTKFGQSWGTLA